MNEIAIVELGVTMSAVFVDSRPDGLMSDMPRGSTHYHITLERQGETMSFYWSQGPAHTQPPTLGAVLENLCMDWQGGETTFEEFCSEMGYDTDSRRIERMYNAVQAQSADLSRLFDGMSIGDLCDDIQGGPY